MLRNKFTTQRTSFTITITTGFHHKTTCYITQSTLITLRTTRHDVDNTKKKTLSNELCAIIHIV